jgi:23S rRNA (uracil1939-C5)-methyltransferase
MAQKKSGPLFFKAAKKIAKSPRQQATVELTIERLSSEGRGMAFRNGKPIFIANALPGEQVRARIYSEKSEFAEADLLTVIEPSPQRRAAPCELFGRCGGCQLQMLDESDQLAHKQKSLRHLLQTFAADEQIWTEALTASPWHYRHRARLAVAEQNGAPIVGFKAANSHRVLAVPSCPVLDLRLQPLLRELPGWLAQLSQWRRLDELLLSVDSAEQIALAWRAQRAFPQADADKLAALCRDFNVLAGGGVRLTYAVPSQATAIAFTTDDFTQVNPAINDQLAVRICAWLAPTPTDVIADFFCGLGNFTLPLAKHARLVDGYDVSAAMVSRARENALTYAIDNVSFHVLDLFEATMNLPTGPTKALLDPPRAGAKLLCEKLAHLKSLQRIVYVSCNPQTLARDIAILVAGGFVLRQAALVDMFPQTGHSEAIVCLARR